jgi:hypothetical protein
MMPMRIRIEAQHSQSSNEPRQLDAIRDLMIAAGERGEWLSLADISALTQFGEASISAQLRNLRKRRYGGYSVDKRRRRIAADAPDRMPKHNVEAHAQDLRDAPWEYRVCGRSGRRALARGGCFMPQKPLAPAAPQAQTAEDAQQLLFARPQLPLLIAFDLATRCEYAVAAAASGSAEAEQESASIVRGAAASAREEVRHR